MSEGKKKHYDLTRVTFILKGLMVGILTGAVVSIFRLAIEKSLMYIKILYRIVPTRPLWLIPIVLVTLFIGWLISRLVKHEPDIMGSGIPQVEGQLAGEIEMKWWSVLWRKFIGGILAIGPGLFLGREGPSIQLGAAIGQGFAEQTKHTGSDRRILIAGGSAAGLAAAFNAPIAGTLFVLEEVYHNFSPLVWMTSLSAAIGANFVSANVFGIVPVLHINYSRPFPLALYWHVILLGIILGCASLLYQKVLLAMPAWYQKITHMPRYLQGVIPLLLVIPIAIFWPESLGGGNSIILGFAKVMPALLPLIGLLVLRFIFSMVSYGSGLPGGIFLPILTLGAVIGALYGVIMVKLGLLSNEYVLNLVIFSMAGYFAGIGKAPFTAILLVTEMVGTLSHLMPLAVISLVAFLVDDLLGGEPIYESLLQRLVADRKTAKLSGKSDRLEIPVFVGSDFEDMQVRDFKWPDNSLLIGVRRGDREIIPHGDTLLRGGDTLIVLTDENQRAIVRNILATQAAHTRNVTP